jgi:NAD(P)-dependent dehydrogenase (short-subunit alcohol dehydrogenase family)
MQLSTEDIEALWRANFYSSFVFSKAVQASLQRSAGTLVHIASLAGLVAAPGMGGYSIAKHAVVAMSRQLRLELAGQDIRVLTVCPGPIQREPSTDGRYDELVQDRSLPESLKRPAGGAGLKSIDPGVLSDRIITAIETRRRELVLPAKVRWLASLGVLWPGLLDYFLKKPR